MERDFTEDKYNELKQYLPTDNGSFWDFIGDMAIINDVWLGSININDYLVDADIYYSTIFDRYDITATSLRTIFSDCRDLDNTYGALVQDFNERVNIYKQYIDKMAKIMSNNPISLTVNSVDSLFIELDKKHQDNYDKLADEILTQCNGDPSKLDAKSRAILEEYFKLMIADRYGGAADISGMDKTERDRVNAAYELLYPENAKRINKFFNDMAKDKKYSEDIANIKYIIYTSPEPYCTLFFKYVDQFKIADYKYEGNQKYEPFEKALYIDFTDDIIKGKVTGEGDNDYRSPYVTFFHEAGHAIDDAMAHDKWLTYISETDIYKGATGQKLFDVAYNDVKTNLIIQIIAADEKNKYYSLNASERQEVLDELMKYNSKGFPGDLAKQAIYEDVKISYLSILSDSSVLNGISDVYGGITNNTVRGLSWHSQQYYWYDSNGNPAYNQNTELWAHYYARNMTGNEETIESFDIYFPTAADLMESMAIKMSK